MTRREITTADVERFIEDTDEIVNLHSGHDFDLDIGNSAWITVGDLSVWVRSANDGTLLIEVFKHYYEADNPIDSFVVYQPEEGE